MKRRMKPFLVNRDGHKTMVVRLAKAAGLAPEQPVREGAIPRLMRVFAPGALGGYAAMRVPPTVAA